MEDMYPGPGTEELKFRHVAIVDLGMRRKVHAQALQDVTDELRRRCILACSEGLSDAYVARTAQVSVTTLRDWLGKGSNGKADR